MRKNSKFKIQNSKLERGFTLIELILYVALVSIMLATLIPFAWSVIEGGVKIGVEQEVYSQARYLSERIKEEVRDASAVTVCNNTTLTLTNPVAAMSPTTFAYASNEVKITQGTQIPAPGIRLHSIDTSITSFACTNYTGANTDNVQITFTLASNYPSATRKAYSESIIIELTAETRD